MANSQIEAALLDATKKLGALLSDASQLTVTTKYIIVGEAPGANASAPAASTTIRLDGDWTAEIPVTKDANGALVPHDFLYQSHKDNVAAASDYRAKVIGALVEALGKVV